MTTFSSLVLASGAVSFGALEDSLRRQALLGGDLATNLLDVGALPESELQRLLAEHHLLPSGPTGSLAPHEDALALVSAEIAARYRVVPLALEGDRLVLATAEPMASTTVRRLRDDVGRALLLMLVTPVRLGQALHRHYAVVLEPRHARLLAHLDRPPPAHVAPEAPGTAAAGPATSSAPARGHTPGEPPGPAVAPEQAIDRGGDDPDAFSADDLDGASMQPPASEPDESAAEEPLPSAPAGAPSSAVERGEWEEVVGDPPAEPPRALLEGLARAGGYALDAVTRAVDQQQRHRQPYRRMTEQERDVVVAEIQPIARLPLAAARVQPLATRNTTLPPEDEDIADPDLLPADDPGPPVGRAADALAAEEIAAEVELAEDPEDPYDAWEENEEEASASVDSGEPEPETLDVVDEELLLASEPPPPPAVVEGRVISRLPPPLPSELPPAVANVGSGVDETDFAVALHFDEGATGSPSGSSRAPISEVPSPEASSPEVSSPEAGARAIRPSPLDVDEETAVHQPSDRVGDSDPPDPSVWSEAAEGHELALGFDEDEEVTQVVPRGTTARSGVHGLGPVTSDASAWSDAFEDGISTRPRPSEPASDGRPTTLPVGRIRDETSAVHRAAVSLRPAGDATPDAGPADDGGEELVRAFHQRARGEVRSEARRPFRHRGAFVRVVAERAVAQADGVGQVLQIVVRYARQYFDRCLLFLVEEGVAEVVGAHGFGPEVGGLTVYVDAAGLFQRACDADGPVIDAFHATGFDATLRSLLRVGKSTVGVVPISLGGQVVALVYGDDRDEDVDAEVVRELAGFAEVVAVALARLLG